MDYRFQTCTFSHFHTRINMSLVHAFIRLSLLLKVSSINPLYSSFWCVCRWCEPAGISDLCPATGSYLRGLLMETNTTIEAHKLDAYLVPSIRIYSLPNKNHLDAIIQIIQTTPLPVHRICWKNIMGTDLSKLSTLLRKTTTPFYRSE